MQGYYHGGIVVFYAVKTPKPQTHTHRHAGAQTHMKFKYKQAYITVYVCNTIPHCGLKCFKASQNEIAPKINSLAPDKKLPVFYNMSFNFAGFSLLLAYECFWPILPGAALYIFICSSFSGEKNISSWCSIKALTSHIVHKTRVMHSSLHSAWHHGIQGAMLWFIWGHAKRFYI